jgi:hypothetical protein
VTSAMRGARRAAHGTPRRGPGRRASVVAAGGILDLAPCSPRVSAVSSVGETDCPSDSEAPSRCGRHIGLGTLLHPESLLLAQGANPTACLSDSEAPSRCGRHIGHGV